MDKIDGPHYFLMMLGASWAVVPGGFRLRI